MFLQTVCVLFGVLGVKGQILPRLDGRIVGGEPTSIETYPYQLSLQYVNSHFCGATLISPKYAITAAHCTNGRSAMFLSVRAGSSRRNTGGLVIPVKAIHQNPSYSSTTIDNDISILELSYSIQYKDTIRPLVLPEKNETIEVGTTVTCTGWGKLSSGGVTPSMLQKVDLETVSKATCSAAYGKGKITDRMLCATAPGKDSCQGDSGGPLAANGKLVGVVSWGYGCANPKYPGVYANVAVLRDFIKEVTGV